MKTLGASEAKNRFGEMLDFARREPVQIAKKGRSVVVIPHSAGTISSVTDHLYTPQVV